MLPCRDLGPALAFFTDRLGFRVEAVFPADSPRTVILSAGGLRVRLDRDATGDPGRLRLGCADPTLADGPTRLEAPNGTRIDLVATDPPLVLPPLATSFVVTRFDDGAFHPGRAGMRYRDLIPDRQGGRIIASHIHIPDGGPVPDYVHYHRVRFQLIYCYRGWVKVVYEDQGSPFTMQAGDCVLQPPRIRHRVLESSPDLEVVEIGSPAEHETFADPGCALPTLSADPSRDFDGQRFLLHVAADAEWDDEPGRGFQARDLGMAAATGRLVDARVLRGEESARVDLEPADAELRFGFVLQGGLMLAVGRAGDAVETTALSRGDACVIPKGFAGAATVSGPATELLLITVD